MRSRRSSLLLRRFSNGAGSIPKDAVMPTPLSLGFDITYHQCPHKSKGQRPMVIVAGWMGAKQRQLKPYLDFYWKHGFDTLSFAVGPKHVLQPDSAMLQMEKVLEMAIKSGDSNGGQTLQKLVFHHFSVGGYLFGQMLLLMEKHPDKYRSIRSLIKAQIFDSPPDMEGVPRGVARSMGIGGVGAKIVEMSLQGYLSLTANTTGIKHRAASDAFHGNDVSAPSLWFYSKADPVADCRDCQTVISKWKGRGTKVIECVWDETPHIQHARVDPVRYFGTLEDFLRNENVI